MREKIVREKETKTILKIERVLDKMEKKASKMTLKKMLGEREFKYFKRLNPIEKLIFKTGFIDGRIYQLGVKK